MRKHPPVTLKQLRSTLGTPRNGSWQVGLDAPAQGVMTDFTQRNMVTVDGRLPVDAALEVMRHAGVRSAFVVEAQQVLGLVTAHDIMGEKPIRYLQSIGCTHRTCSRDDVKVADIMERAEDWYVVTAGEVESASVGSILEALQRAGRTHLPVVEPAAPDRPALRGVFSRAKLLRLTEQARAAPALHAAGGA